MDTDKALDEIAESVLNRIAARAKAAGTTPTTAFAHGPTGIFAQPGQRATIVNAMAMPLTLLDHLPAKRSVWASEVYAILTGQTAATGSNPSTPCGDGKTAGSLKRCQQVWPFGRFVLDSQVMQADRTGLLTWRSEFVDQMLVGNPFADVQPPAGAEWNMQEALRNEKAKNILQLFVDWKRTFAPILYTGDPANNTGDQGNGVLGYGEPWGLDTILNTGYRDAISGVVCPAADPLLVDFGGANVETDATITMQTLVNVYRDRDYLARRLGFVQPQWAWVMRYSAFIKLCDLWPIAYNTYRNVVTTADQTTFNIGTDLTKIRDQMLAGYYLLINGVQVPVIVDDSIAETVPSDKVGESSIYLVPLSSPSFGHNDGGAITYVEFFDMSDPAKILQEGFGAYPQNTYQVMGGGRYLIYPKAPSNTCIQYGMVSRERLICEAPFLGARITNVEYGWNIHERSPFTNDPYYFVNGGGYTGSAPSFYSPQA